MRPSRPADGSLRGLTPGARRRQALARAAVGLVAAAVTSVSLALAGAGCDQIVPTLGSNSAAAGATSSSSAQAAACTGFRDVQGVCRDVGCLQDGFCTPDDAEVSCGLGLKGQGACFAGRCAFVNPTQGCASAADCRCGLCGVDGRCYEGRNGTCGTCSPSGGTAPGNPSGAASPCKTCLASCAGTGPLCCAGAGCLCEGQCGPYL